MRPEWLPLDPSGSRTAARTAGCTGSNPLRSSWSSRSRASVEKEAKIQYNIIK